MSSLMLATFLRWVRLLSFPLLLTIHGCTPSTPAMPDREDTPPSAIDAGSRMFDAGSMESGDVRVGVLTAFRTEGLRYATESLTGVTDMDGGFRYRAGETVTFSIGTVEIGGTLGEPELDLFDLFGAEIPTGVDAIEQAQCCDFAFRRVINAAILLATFDDDGDLSNGVRITSEVDGLFVSADTDINNPLYRTLPTNSADSRALHQMRLPGEGNHAFAEGSFYRAVVAAQAHFAVPHPPPPTVDVMQRLYDAVSVAPRLFSERRWAPRSGSETMAEFDPVGRLTKLHYGAGLGGSTRVEESFAYDRFGYVVSTERQWTTEEGEERIEGSLVEYDSHGLLHATEDEESRDLYFYDDDGRPTRMEIWWAGHTTISALRETAYDDQGRLAREDFELFEFEPYRQTAIYEYDGDSNLIRHRQSRNGATDPRVTTFTYDDSRRIVRTEISSTGRVETTTYGPHGALVLEIDEDGDGTIDSRETWDYDATGRRIRTASDNEADGIEDSSTEWTYDAEGKLVEETTRRAGVLGSKIHYSYDAHGRVIQIARDSDADGAIDHWRFRHFGAGEPDLGSLPADASYGISYMQETGWHCYTPIQRCE